MARILLAASPDDVASLERVLKKRHELVIATTMTAASKALKEQAFDLIIAGLHFDDSRMFDLIQMAKRNGENSKKPIISFCSRDTQMSRTMHHSLEFAARAVGAWMYIDQHEFNVSQDPDAEMLRIIERCIAGETRAVLQERRKQIQRSRDHIQEKREALEAMEWSPKLEEQSSGLRHDLEELLELLSHLQSDSNFQKESIEQSRKLEDRVANQVTALENGMTRQENIQSLDVNSNAICQKNCNIICRTFYRIICQASQPHVVALQARFLAGDTASCNEPQTSKLRRELSFLRSGAA